ncbi:CDP-alcohol phosphatidyltransferase family protein [Campylobacter showae]|jgi:phosphomethylpyrimidine kinase|uniref:CDP-alcohol phosphatidyltransferase family protein n=1 Tax=Campylobacter showae TaxID=204 RepID=UPI000F098386|nr:CDP-alcohol phosphatidyltransferase family protein [Campylobacter showae]
MSIYELKPKFQNLLRPLVRRLYSTGVTANQVTLAACVLSVLLGALLVKFADVSTLFFLLPIWMFLRMALNAIDGMLAREFNQKTPLGGYLNEATDVISDTALYLPFAFVAPFGWGVIALVIFLAFMSEFLGVLGQVHGSGRRYDGPMGKSDRAFVFGLMGTIYAVFGQLPAWFGWTLYVVAFLLALTCINRVRMGLKG